MSKTIFAFIATYLGGLTFSLFVDGAYGIYLYQIDYFLNPRIRWWYGSLPAIRYSFIIAVTILLSYLIRKEKYSQNRIMDIPHFKWLISLVILMGLVSLIAVWPERHQRIYETHLKIMAFIFLLYKMVDSPEKFEKMIWTFLGGCFYIGWIAHSVGRSGAGRLEGIGPADANDSNGLASVLISSIPVLVFYLMEAKKYWQKFLSLVFFVFILNAIILINSRGAFLGMAISLCYFSYIVFSSKVKNKKTKKKIGIGIVLGCIMFAQLADESFWNRISTIGHVERGESGEIENGGNRVYFWKKGLELVQEYPFGVGAWGYAYLSPQFIPEEMLSGGTSGNVGKRAAHSTWVSTLVEYGYLGLILFLGYLLSCFRLNRKVRNYLLEGENYYLYYQNVAISAGFLAFLIHCTFKDRLYAEVMYWWPAFMACFANIYYIKKL